MILYQKGRASAVIDGTVPFPAESASVQKAWQSCLPPPPRGYPDRAYDKIAQPTVKRQLSARDISDIPPQVENGQAKTGKLNIFQLGNYLIY